MGVAAPFRSELMRLATWNVNSIRIRLSHVLAWLQKTIPDIVLLQEIKCPTALFPKKEFIELGYQHHLIVGQKSYNGVALLSKWQIQDIQDSLIRLPGDEQDNQARYLEVIIEGMTISSLYLPNGNPVDSEKYLYKLKWMERLACHVEYLLEQEQPFVLGGDFNIIPAPEDVYDPVAWKDDALFCQEARMAFRRVLFLGLIDAYRACHPANTEKTPAYTFWDYQNNRWIYDQGLRIDHFLLSPQVGDRLVDCMIDREPRGLSRASDHTPLILDLLNT